MEAWQRAGGERARTASSAPPLGTQVIDESSQAASSQGKRNVRRVLPLGTQVIDELGDAAQRLEEGAVGGLELTCDRIGGIGGNGASMRTVVCGVNGT
jgi:hypothetical protein